MKSPAVDIHFSFRSIRTADPALEWRVRIDVPANSTDASAFPMTVTDADGRAVEAGEFEIHGVRCAVRDGRSVLPASAFLAGLRSTRVWFIRDGREPVPGGLTFL